MMIDPVSYVEMHKDESYMELMEERNRLFRKIQDYENKVILKNVQEAEEEFYFSQTVYQMNLCYLAQLCSFMKEKYTDDYVWGDQEF